MELHTPQFLEKSHIDPLKVPLSFFLKKELKFNNFKIICFFNGLGIYIVDVIDEMQRLYNLIIKNKNFFGVNNEFYT